MWDDWAQENAAKVKRALGQGPRPAWIGVIRTEVDLGLLDFKNAMVYEHLLNPGQQDQVERFTLHRVPEDEINRIVREYANVCLGVDMQGGEAA